MPRTKSVLRGLMALLYFGAGVNHFVDPAFYVSLMPPYIPWHLAMVWLSGVAEILLAIGVVVPKTRRLAGWGVIALLVAVFPVHVHMLMAEAGTYDVPRWALWARIPLQGLLMLWAWWVTRPAPNLESDVVDA